MHRRTQTPHRIGVALSGGTLKAAAHVGVLGGLEELGITPDCIAGTSAGAFVASLYAHGYGVSELTDLIRHFPGASLFDYGFPLVSSLLNLWWYKWPMNQVNRKLHLPHGLLRGRKLEKYYRSHLQKREARMPYYVIATDLLTGEPVIYTNDTVGIDMGIGIPMEDVSKCVLGSCCVPGVLTPVQVGPHLLVDGAFRHYVPVDVLRLAGCDKIIAVNLHHLQKEWSPETFVHVLARSFEILLQESIEGDVDGPDIVVLAPEVGHLSWVSFDKMESCVTIGRHTVHSHKEDIQNLLTTPTHPQDWANRHCQPVVRISSK